jgi:hypothetical protein
MALDLLTSTSEDVEIVATQDPAVRSANGEDALKRYRASHDIGDLSVPDDATVFRVRGLTQADRKGADRAAGRKSDLGAMMHARLNGEAMRAAVEEQAEQMAEAVRRRLGVGDDAEAHRSSLLGHARKR